MEAEGKIYVIWAEGTDLVKIGYTGGDPWDRLAKLQTGCPHRLVLFKRAERGTRESEKRWHEKYAAQRVHGEWFRMDHEMKWMLTVVFQSPAWTREQATAEKEAYWDSLEPPRPQGPPKPSKPRFFQLYAPAAPAPPPPLPPCVFVNN